MSRTQKKNLYTLPYSTCRVAQALFYFSFANNWHTTSTYINSLYLSWVALSFRHKSSYRNLIQQLPWGGWENSVRSKNEKEEKKQSIILVVLWHIEGNNRAYFKSSDLQKSHFKSLTAFLENHRSSTSLLWVFETFTCLWISRDLQISFYLCLNRTHTIATEENYTNIWPCVL